nr:hypothetical protein [Austwickia chelonae]
MISAYRDPDRTAGRTEMSSVIDALTEGVPKPLVELCTLGRTLARRALTPLYGPLPVHPTVSGVVRSR